MKESVNKLFAAHLWFSAQGHKPIYIYINKFERRIIYAQLLIFWLINLWAA